MQYTTSEAPRKPSKAELEEEMISLVTGNLKDELISDLLALYVSIMEELRRRNVLRSENIPTGDLAEYLFCQTFGWTQGRNSQKGFDAESEDGTRYQIKGRRLNIRNPSRQVSQIRDIDRFDFLAAVLFDHDYQVQRAALIPAQIVKDSAIYVTRTNSYRFMLQDGVWDMAGVRDVTEQIAETFFTHDIC